MPVRGADGGLWEIATTRSQRWEAEMLQGFLETHGVRTWLQSFDASAAAHPGAGAQNVLVPEEDLELARELLETGTDPVDASEAQLEDEVEGSSVQGGGDRVDSLEGRLLHLLIELVAIPSVTGEEGEIADWLAARYEGREVVRRVGNSLVVGASDRSRANVLLVGHLDTVPAAGDTGTDPSLEDGMVHGRGTSDMKSGLAVAMDCFEDAGLRTGPANLLLVAYAGEEGPHETNELGALLAELPDLARADLAVVLEPTDLTIQLGCLGTLHADLTFRGQAAHSARPWLGENALTGAGEFLDELHRRGPEDIDVDGLVYREVFTATTAHTANARNVVPDTFTINLNYRFSPARTVREAEERLRDLVGDRAEVVITDRAPAASPRRDAPMVASFVSSVGAAVEPKQAWTDVARLDAAGVPALNYGPGLAAQAHQVGEHVPAANLAAARAALARFFR